jgi:hypothetical protein
MRGMVRCFAHTQVVWVHSCLWLVLCNQCQQSNEPLEQCHLGSIEIVENRMCFLRWQIAKERQLIARKTGKQFGRQSFIPALLIEEHC